jgi:nicotinate-nucleotide adenylyltransferase
MDGKRIGIFGGTFDPPHTGHLMLGEEIREEFCLDEVHFLPCNQPPHKDRPDLTPAKDRFAMVVAATLQNPAFVASPIEVNRPGESYSIDTVRRLRDEFGDETELLFVVGLDSFLDIETWEGYKELLNMCHFIVVSRPGHGFDDIPARLPDWIVERVVDLRSGDIDPCSYLGAVGTGSPRRVFLSDRVFVDISSTSIRERIIAGRSIRYRVPAEVERYIQAHGLYREAAKPAEAVS